MSTRRSFLTGAGVAGLVGSSFRADALARAVGADKAAGQSPACELASNEDYWAEIQRAFDTDRTISTSTTAASVRLRHTFLTR